MVKEIVKRRAKPKQKAKKKNAVVEKKPVVKKKKSASAMGKNSSAYACPDLFSKHFALSIHKTTPYTVIRERRVVTTATNTGADRVIMVGPVASLTTGQASSMIAINNLSTDAIASANGIASSMITTAAHGLRVRMRLNRLSVTVACNGNAIGAVPPGHVYLGTLDGPIDIANFPNFSDLVTFLEARNQLRGHTAKACADAPVRLASHPLDKLDWSQFKILNNTNPSPVTRFEDTMAPIAIVIKAQSLPSALGVTPSDYTINWTISIHAEYCVVFGNDAILQATHRTHPTVSDNVVDSVTNVLRNAGGFVASAAPVMENLENVVESGLGIARRFGL